jgi:hypothetical protein
VQTGQDFGTTDKDGSFAKFFFTVIQRSLLYQLLDLWKILEQPKITMKSQSNLHDLQQSSKPTSTYVHGG